MSVTLFEEDTYKPTEKKDGKDFKPVTKNGYNMDEVVSAMQKEIRRGKVREATYWALELFDSGFWKYPFKRLCTIATEDVGNANPILVNSCFLIYDFVNNSKTPPDACLLGYLILGLCDSIKSREADDLVNEVERMRRTLKEKNMLLEVPEYAIDKHTKRGKERGKTYKDFWAEGCKLEGEQIKSRFVGYVPGEGDGYNKE